MKKHIISGGIYIFSKKEATKEVIIFSHSLSDNHESELIKGITQKLYDSDIAVVVYDFSFIKNGLSPSADLSLEIKDLEHVISIVSDKIHPDRIILIGKSLGGIVSAAYCSKKTPLSVSSVFVIGFPFKLGFPPNFQLLKDANPILPDYISQYKSLFDSIKLPIHIIQGDQDDLGEVDECTKFVDKYASCNLSIISGSNHGFISPSNKAVTYYKRCAEIILSKISNENK